MSKLLLLLVIGAPLFASPEFRLYDCKGKEATCRGLFPGEAAPLDGPWQFTQGDRVVINGIDLGKARSYPSRREPAYGTTFDAFYFRDPWVIGWEYCCDGDHDGGVVKWLLDGGTATLIRGPVSGPGPPVFDVNSKGQLIGGGFGVPFFYDDQLMEGILSHTEAPAYLSIPGTTLLNSQPMEMLRINDAGQVLFTAGYSDDPWLLVLSPFDAPVPESLTHAPEPGTVLLMGCGLLAMASRRRGRCLAQSWFRRRFCR